MRVITPFGFGDISESRRTGNVQVELDQPFLGDKVMTLDAGSQVFPFTEVAVARILNISGAGWFSNLQFHKAPKEQFFLPTPPDETTFFLSLASGDFLVNRELGTLAQKALWIQPWVDNHSLKGDAKERHTSTLPPYEKTKIPEKRDQARQISPLSSTQDQYGH